MWRATVVAFPDREEWPLELPGDDGWGAAGSVNLPEAPAEERMKVSLAQL